MLQHAIIAVLVSQLGSDSFETRERAHSALAKLGTAAHLHLALAENSRDTETRTRARRLLDRWYADNAERIADAMTEKFPWVVADETDDDLKWAQDYLKQARAKVGIHGPPAWDDYRLATRMMVVGMIRRREPLERARIVVGRLKCSEREWVKTFGMRYCPAIQWPE